MPTLIGIKPIRVVLRPETTIRVAPDLTTPGAWVVGKETQVTAIAKCDGVDFGSGPVWYAYVMNAGGVRFFHSQDIVRSWLIGGSDDPFVEGLNAKIAELSASVLSLEGRVSTLQSTVDAQAGNIANLKTELATATSALTKARSDLAEAVAAKEVAETAAREATAAAAGAVALKDALRNFLG